jgi:ABC-type siderophore export system fused ATPase/permease subunit
MITHEDEVAAHADRLVRLADGRVVADESLGIDEAAHEVGAARPGADPIGAAPGAPLLESA